MAGAANQIEVIRDAFNAFDADGSGSIDSNEIKNVFNKLRIKASDSELQAFLGKLDRNHDGKISFAEFAKILGNKKYYEVADKNHDGDISLAEVVDLFD